MKIHISMVQREMAHLVFHGSVACGENEVFREIHDDYIKGDFSLCGLSNQVPCCTSGHHTWYFSKEIGLAPFCTVQLIMARRYLGTSHSIKSYNQLLRIL